MTWERYCSWIQTTFGSQLTLTQAIEAMENLNQSKSATLYSAQFNELISAIAAAGVTYDVKHLCVKYLQGLKLHLRTMPELFRITDNLDRLQQEAEKLDDLMFRHGKRTNNNGNNNAHQKSPRQYGNFPRRSSMPSFQSSFPNASADDPMDLTNTQQFQRPPSRFRRLSPEEKALYRSKGWCTYCQSKHHDTDHCQKQ
ncbi:hypothetical protein BCR33DRAFT_721310 [Rhizoclosmatium globosum]|uniref:Uncharacterized protein n=1 Tax=Rhizoclosmatium globosum TaxID=329046 RepID=A0A1Y2BS18_9FUNG|nr:hypothetical protein BCR33DRAFT_721310 [Rhizoclosmatium globosum]|eukprot:ORY37561.1 hypothetical protein BCR33DRAFT_721310 [Rhizoclosmatium globosum]